MSWVLDGRPIGSVLLTRLRYLGDIVMSTVLVEVLRRGDPLLDIGYLCEDGFAPVLAGHPGIDRLHRLRSGRTGRDAAARIREASSGAARGTLGIIGELRRARYDLAVDMFFNPRSAWLLKLSGIPLRIGGTRKSRGRLYTHRVVRDLGADEPGFGRVAPGGLGEHLCRLAPLVHGESGQGFISWLQANFGPGELVPKLGSAGFPSCAGPVPQNPYLLLAPCATWRSKEWPLERWLELVPMLLQNTDHDLAVMVAPGREDAWSALAAAIPPGRGGVLPAMPLEQALGCVAGARAVVSVDGGIMHAAVGCGVPTVAVFGPTDPAIWFPYEAAGPYRVLARAPHCHPCDLHECPAFICLPELAAGAVWQSLGALLEPAGATGGEIT